MVNGQPGRGLGRYDAESYISAIAFLSRDPKKRVLVEGSEDARFFECLRATLELEGVVIEDADFRIPGREEDRRENVEYVARRLSSEHPRIASRFVGFADREFDDFDISNSSVTDVSNGQRQVDRLIYSRGHSIENYVFEYDLIEDALTHFYPTGSSYRATALKYMEDHFGDVMSVACAMSLAALDVRLIRKVGDALYGLRAWNSCGQILSFEDSSAAVELNESDFLIRLFDEGVEQGEAGDFISKYRYYLGTLSKSPNQVVERWLCHGHIGMHIIRIAYATFIYHSWNKIHPSGHGTPPISMIDTMLNRWDWIEGGRSTFSWAPHYCRSDDMRTSPVRCFAELELL